MKVGLLVISAIVLSSCGNKVEEVKNPKTGLLQLRYEYYEDFDGQKIKDGKFSEWKNDGSLKLEQNYTDGLLNGKVIEHDSKGLVINSNYKKGKLDGDYTVIVDNVLRFEQKYDDGVIVGDQSFYDSKGKLLALATNDKNGILKEWKSFNYTGKIKARFHFNDSGGAKELVGKWVQQNTGEKEFFYLFFEDGTFEYWEPLIKISTKAFVRLKGNYSFTDKLDLSSFRNEVELDIKSFAEGVMVIKSDMGEVRFLKE